MPKKKKDKKEEIINFSNEEIEKIKSMLEDVEIVEEDDLEKLKKQKKKIYTDSIILAKLFIECYSYFSVNLESFKNEENDYGGKLISYLDKFDIVGLRDQIEEYGNGEDYGSHYIGERIKKIVDGKRTEIIDLVLLFFKIFGEE